MTCRIQEPYDQICLLDENITADFSKLMFAKAVIVLDRPADTANRRLLLQTDRTGFAD